MLSKKIISLILSAAALTPAAVTAIEAVNPECVEAATQFVSINEVSDDEIPGNGCCLYAMPPATGDVNDDDKVDMLDYTLLKAYINAENVKIDKFNADLNRDDEIDFLDLLLLKQKI